MDTRDRYKLDPHDKIYRAEDILDPDMGMTFRIAAALLAAQWDGWYELESVLRGALTLGAALAISAMLEWGDEGPPDAVHPVSCMGGWFDGWAGPKGALLWAEQAPTLRREMTAAARLVWEALTPWTGRSALWAPLVQTVEDARMRAALDINVDNLDLDAIWTDEVEA